MANIFGFCIIYIKCMLPCLCKSLIIMIEHTIKLVNLYMHIVYNLSRLSCCVQLHVQCRLEARADLNNCSSKI